MTTLQTTGDPDVTPGSPSPMILGNPETGNGLISALNPPVFRCPSDNGNPLLDDSPGDVYTVSASNSIKSTKTNYELVVSRSPFSVVCNGWSRQPNQERRMFGENSTTRIASVTDGLSNTIAVGETTLENANGRTPSWAYRGWVQIGVDPGEGINVWASDFTKPIDTRPGRPEARPGTVGNFAWSGSLHTQGANFCFGDGSVRFINENTPNTVLQGLSTMAGGEVVTLP